MGRDVVGAVGAGGGLVLAVAGLGLGLTAGLACTAAPAPPVANRVAAPSGPTTASRPVITAARATPRCPLAWDELDAAAPARIELRPIPAAGTALPDDCPADFDPAAGWRASCPDCARGELAPGRLATLEVEGPAGSGRFARLGLVVGGPRPGYACVAASTVGWRHLYRVAELLAPLPWLADVGDDDATVELVAWQRLPFGGSEAEVALVPVVYELDGDALVRRDDHGRALAARVGAAYVRLADIADPGADVACYRVVARALAGWATP